MVCELGFGPVVASWKVASMQNLWPYTREGMYALLPTTSGDMMLVERVAGEWWGGGFTNESGVAVYASA